MLLLSAFSASLPASVTMLDFDSAKTRLGASPRAAQALLVGSKVVALAHGRTHVARQDVCDLAQSVLKHRILLDVRAQTEGYPFNHLLEALSIQAQRHTQPRMSYRTRQVLRATM
jgi:MoxR-like ATPase